MAGFYGTEIPQGFPQSPYATVSFLSDTPFFSAYVPNRLIGHNEK